MNFNFLVFKVRGNQVPVAHAVILGTKEAEIRKLAQANSLGDPISKNTHHKSG
jgi:hypothetical protein